MKALKIYCVKCNKLRKFVNPKISHIFDKTLIPLEKDYLKKKISLRY